jgi:hypothetical protein
MKGLAVIRRLLPTGVRSSTNLSRCVTPVANVLRDFSGIEGHMAKFHGLTRWRANREYEDSEAMWLPSKDAKSQPVIVPRTYKQTIQIRQLPRGKGK